MMGFATINWLAVLAAVIVSMGIGAAWYGALAKRWIEASGFSQSQIEKIEANDSPGIYVVAALCHVVMAIVLSGVVFHVMGAKVSATGGALTGFLCWLGFVATSLTVNQRFQMKPWSLTIIDAGQYFLVLLAQGIIIGWFGF